jgi:hypothetical protein
VKRSLRVVFSTAAATGLLGGAGVALGAIPSALPAVSASHPVQRPAVTPSPTAELARLRGEFGRTGSDGRQLRQQIARLQADIKRTRVRKAQQARQAAAAEAAQRAAQVAAAQAAARADASYPGPGESALRPAQPALQPARPADRPADPPVVSKPTPAPSTHTSTGASGASPAPSEPGDDGGGDD